MNIQTDTCIYNDEDEDLEMPKDIDMNFKICQMSLEKRDMTYEEEIL